MFVHGFFGFLVVSELNCYGGFGIGLLCLFKLKVVRCYSGLCFDLRPDLQGSLDIGMVI